MAGLGNGCFRFSNSVNNKKSHVYLKLTESAQKALEEYLKCRNNCKSQPTIAFNGDLEGEIKFPSQSHEGSSFKFQMQKAESDAPQGSFESIRQGDNHSLDSLGPLLSVMRIQANDDSYGRAKGLLAHAMAQNGKTCVKELNGNGIPRHRPTRPQKTGVPPSKKEPTSFTPAHFASNIYSSHNGNTTTSSTSPHGANSVSKPSFNPPIKPPHLNGKKVNEALKKRPLRERIIQLLAYKPMNKLQLMNKLHADGIKECDKRNITSTVQGIASLKDSVYHLPKHMWSEVNENWPFFTEEEKLSVTRNNPLKCSPPERDLASTPQSPPKAKNSFSPSAAPGFSDSLKRRVESNYSPTAKKARVANSGKYSDGSARFDKFSNTCNGVGPPLTAKGAELERRLSPCYDPEVRTSTRPSRFAKKNYPPPDNQSKLQERRLDPLMSALQDNSLMNGHHSPSGASVSPLSQNNSPKNMSNNHNNNTNHNNNNYNNNSKSDANNYSLSNGLVSQVPEGRRNGLSKKDKSSGASSQLRNGIPNGGNDSPSPENQQENLDVDTIDTLEDFKLRFLKIEDNEQRRRYKSDFNKIYANYKVLHSELEKTKSFFKELDVMLEAHEYGSPEYLKIKEKMLIEYNKRQPNFQEKKQRYYYLDEVLKHIKQLVSEYDSVQRF